MYMLSLDFQWRVNGWSAGSTKQSRMMTRMAHQVLYLGLLLTSTASVACLPDGAAIDVRVRAAMAETAPTAWQLP